MLIIFQVTIESLSNICKMNIFITNIKEIGSFNIMIGRYMYNVILG